MTGDEKNKIIGEDYVDFIIDNRTNNKINKLFPEALIKSISDIYAVVHIPSNQVNAQSISPLRWIMPPKLFGLTSDINLEASGVEKLRRIPSFDLKGEGVLIGIVDTGINYTHPAFLKLNGNSKIISIWDQTTQSDTPLPYELSFGTEFRNEQINQALQSETPLSIVPSMDENGHGTMLAGVAAGTEDSTKEFYGVAPDAELVVVKLAPSKQFIRRLYSIPDGPVCFQENNIMWGVKYCVEVAKQHNRPIVICIGVGTSQGAHDGTSPLSQQLSSLADKQGIGIVTSVGNERNNRRHFSGVIEPSRNGVEVELNVGVKDKSFTMELWGDSPGKYSIDIVSPYGEYISRISATLRLSHIVSFIFDRTKIDIEYQTVENQTGDELIFFNFHNASPGIWKFTVYVQGNLPGKFNIWLPMGEFISNDTFFTQHDNYTTLVTPGDSRLPITVTAYNSLNNALYMNASRGYTRNNTIKPELAAPGVNYLAPDLNGGYIYYSGSGVAAAHTSGIIAIALEWGLVKRNQKLFDTNEIKKYMIRGAKRSTILTYPNQDWGYGMIDIFNTIDALRQRI